MPKNKNYPKIANRNPFTFIAISILYLNHHLAIAIFAQFTTETFYERRRKVQTNFQKFLKVKIKRRGSVARTKNQILMDSVKTKPQHLQKK